MIICKIFYSVNYLQFLKSIIYKKSILSIIDLLNAIGLGTYVSFIYQMTQSVLLTSSGQSYKVPTIVIYDSRVVPDLKLPPITTLES